MDPHALLERARLLAERGRGIVEPNPLVGAIAFANGEIVGEGWHARYGGPHAEEVALEQCLVRGIEPDTLVVTLEPCSSVGSGKRRPPCTELIEAAGIRRVIVGMLDPDPRHRGGGLDVLRRAGIDVLGPFPSKALEELLTRFLRALSLERPWVLGKWAMTLDGKTATHSGSSRWISGDEALDWAHELRATADAVLVGIGTALTDDPELTVRRVVGRDPLRVVLDAEADLAPGCRLLTTKDRSKVVVFVGKEADEERRRRLEATGALVIRLDYGAPSATGRRRVDLDRALAILRTEFGVRRLLVEGGGETLARFFERGAVDEVATCIAPKIVGGRTAPTPLGGVGIAEMGDARVLDDVRMDVLGSCVRLHGFVRQLALVIFLLATFFVAGCGSTETHANEQLGIGAKFATVVPAESMASLRRAEVLIDRGDSAGALAILDPIVQEFPLFVAAARARQILLRARGRAGLLWGEVEALEQLHGGRPEPHYLATRLICNLRERSEVIVRGLERWPTSWWACYSEAWRRSSDRGSSDEDDESASLRLAEVAAEAEWPHGAELAMQLHSSTKKWREASALFEGLAERFPEDASLALAQYRAGKSWWEFADVGLRGAPESLLAGDVLRRVLSNGVERRALCELLRSEPHLIARFVRHGNAAVLVNSCELEGATDIVRAVQDEAVAQGRHHDLERVSSWYFGLTRSRMHDAVLRGDLETAIALYETTLPQLALVDETNRMAGRTRTLLAGPYRGIRTCPEDARTARGALRALLDCGWIDECIVLGRLWSRSHPELAELADEARRVRDFSLAVVERLTSWRENVRLEECIDAVREASRQILGEDIVGEPRVLSFPFIGGRIVDPFGPGLPRFFDRYGQHFILGTLDEPTRRPAVGFGVKVFERRLPVRPGLQVPGRSVEIVLEHWRYASSLGLGFSEPAGIALWNHYVLDLRKWDEWVDDLVRMGEVLERDGLALLDDAIPTADALSLGRPAQVHWKLFASWMRDHGHDRKRIETEVLTLLRLHEHAHLVDAQRFLPAMRNPGGSFRLLAQAGFQTQLVMADLEGRAEVAALARGADPRLTLGHMTSFLGEAYKEGDSPHRIGFARMLRRLVALWAADGAPGARDPEHNLMAQLHLLDPGKAVAYARTVLGEVGF